MLIQLKFPGYGLQHVAGRWAAAVLCASSAAACSGKFETQTDYSPPRVQRNEATGAASASTAAPPRAAATPTPTAAAARPPAAAAARPPAAAAPAAPPAAPAETAPVDDAPAGGGDLSFEADIWPIFNAQCGPCHVSIGLGAQNIGSADLVEALADSKSFEDAVISEIEAGTMPPSCGAPPGGAGCVSADDLELIEAWYEAGAAP